MEINPVAPRCLHTTCEDNRCPEQVNALAQVYFERAQNEFIAKDYVRSFRFARSGLTLRPTDIAIAGQLHAALTLADIYLENPPKLDMTLYYAYTAGWARGLRSSK